MKAGVDRLDCASTTCNLIVSHSLHLFWELTTEKDCLLGDHCPSCTLNTFFLRSGSADVICSLVPHVSYLTEMHHMIHGGLICIAIRMHIRCARRVLRSVHWPCRYLCIAIWSRNGFRIAYNEASRPMRCLSWEKDAVWLQISTCICIVLSFVYVSLAAPHLMHDLSFLASSHS